MKQLLDLFRYFKCFAEISISGGFPERFLNLCNREKIYLWDVMYCNGSVTAKIYCRDFLRLRKIRSKTGVKIKITRKHGLLFSLKKNKKRSVLFIGTAAALLFMLVLNRFVWVIDIKGNESLSRTEILEAAAELGLRSGTLVPFFDEGKAGRDIVNLSDGRILWAAINIKGSKAVIEIREASGTEEKKEEDSSPCNVVADFDGIVLSCETYSGIAATAKGNAVRVGDILISGISENPNGSVNFHNAEGKITALHKSELELDFEEKQKAGKLSVTEKYSKLFAFSLQIPLSLKAFGDEENGFTYRESICLDGTVLPFGIEHKVCVREDTEATAESTLLEAVDEFSRLEYEKYKNTLITSAEYKITHSNKGAKISSSYECIDFIGKKTDILQEN